jgi:uncharacterized membrane protein YdjX (TVP38/TMEM64 family)
MVMRIYSWPLNDDREALMHDLLRSRPVRIVTACTILLGAILIPFALWGERIELHAMHLLAASPDAIAFSGIALLAADVMLPVPSSIVATVMGALLGGPMGTVVNAIGLTLGCAVGLLVGRGGSPLARRVLGEALFADFVRWIDRRGLIAVMLCRAVPVLAEASIIAAGAGQARPWRILIGAGLADIALGAVYAFAGATQGPAATPTALAFAAAILLPAVAAAIAMIAIRRTR